MSQSLFITFSYPSGPFSEVYRSTRPRLLLAGAEVPVPGWGRHEFTAGIRLNAVKVCVPFGGTDDFGLAEHNIVVREGENVDLEYLAPSVLGLKGRIRVAGETR